MVQSYLHKSNVQPVENEEVHLQHGLEIKIETSQPENEIKQQLEEAKTEK